ncbi:type III secretion system outer membrane ring subunit SctC [Paraburkholderia hayleyella]|uniref:type III secretion system outer membrane ring subunit SctC n=1 Tax=Paraburkholderia hayleyella TaxID=2152889 RepID=UPI001FE6491F|nr:type III secretion system outer membrane ring subunit SctC [Paraburkholderia hayleyella]
MLPLASSWLLAPGSCFSLFASLGFMTIFFLRRVRVACATLSCLSSLLSAAALAAPIAWHSSRFEYVAEHKDLKDVLRDFSASQHLMTWISPNVEGTVSGSFSSSPQRFLEQMANSFGVLWYYDGAVLRIFGANEAKSATVGLAHVSVEALRGTLQRLKIDDPRFPVRYDSLSRTALVSGPPRYVELVASVAALIDHASVPDARVIVQRFPLQYAWATDRHITVNGRAVTVRGVAAVLRSLYGQNDGAIAALAAPERSAYRMPSARSEEARGVASGVQQAGGSGMPPLPGLGGLGLSGEAGSASWPERFDETSDRPVGFGERFDAGRAGSSGGAFPRRAHDAADEALTSPQVPMIEADTRSNSILVRDRAGNMEAFGALIHSLDLRPGVLEIDASIIEITDNALQELGVDWQLHGSHVHGSSGTGRLDNGERDASGALLAPGGVLTAVIGGSGRYLLGRISVLQQSDQARIIASPKVETLDNVEAVMENKQTFYVEVGGYQSGDLYSVSAGVSLRVLPTIVTAAPGRQIRLDMHIEDGKLTEQKVGPLPVIESSTIDTQALMNEGESLLIAGYSIDQNDHSETAVPWLSQIPFIGGLFRFRHSQGRRFQRLFLLTPRILSAQPPAEGADVALAAPAAAASRTDAMPNTFNAAR